MPQTKQVITLTLKGYRQVGKTAMAELLRQALLEKGVGEVHIHTHPKAASNGPAVALENAMRRGFQPELWSVRINDLDDYQVAEKWEGPECKFNPYTGAARSPDDIKTDPRGLLIVSPERWATMATTSPTTSHNRSMLVGGMSSIGAANDHQD